MSKMENLLEERIPDIPEWKANLELGGNKEFNFTLFSPGEKIHSKEDSLESVHSKEEL